MAEINAIIKKNQNPLEDESNGFIIVNEQQNLAAKTAENLSTENKREEIESPKITLPKEATKPSQHTKIDLDQIYKEPETKLSHNRSKIEYLLLI